MEMTSAISSSKEAEYMLAWQKVWLDHVYWTRLAVIGIVHDVPALDKTVERLLRNVDDMLALMTNAYGADALAPLRDLLRDHLGIAAKLVTEAKQGSPEAAQTEKDWYANADEISKFLSSANQNLGYQAVKDMFDRHLKMTKDEAVYRLTEDWGKDIPNYEDIEAEAIMMGEAFASAMMKQFPDTFA